MFSRVFCAVVGAGVGAWGWTGGAIKAVVVSVHPFAAPAAAWLNQVGADWIHLWVVVTLLVAAAVGGAMARVVGRILGGGALFGWFTTAVWGGSGITLHAGPFRVVLQPALDWAAQAAQAGYTAVHLRHPWSHPTGWAPSPAELVRAGLDDGFRLGERVGWDRLSAQTDHAVAVYTSAQEVLICAASPAPLTWTGFLGDQASSIFLWVMVGYLVEDCLGFKVIPRGWVWLSHIIPPTIRFGEALISPVNPKGWTWAGGWLKVPEWWMMWARSDAARERQKWEERRADLDNDPAAHSGGCDDLF